MNPLVQLLLGFMTVCVCNTTGKYCKNTLPGVSKVIQGVDLKSFDINKPGEGRLNPIIEMKCDQTRIRRYAGKDYQVPYEVKYINPISSGTFDESLFYIDKVENLAKMFSFEVTHKQHKFETKKQPKKSSKRKRADIGGAGSMINAAASMSKLHWDQGNALGGVVSHIIRRYGGNSDEIKPDLRYEGVIGSNSKNFKRIRNSVQNKKKTHLYSKAQVKTMEVRLAPAAELKLHPTFLKDLKELPRNLTKITYEGQYLPFLKKYGTHYIERAILGGTAYLVHKVEKEFFEKSLTSEDAQFFSRREFDKTFDQHHNYEHPENYEESTSSESTSRGRKNQIWTDHSEENMFYVGGDPNLGKDRINLWQPTVRTSPELLSVELNPLYRLIKDDEDQRFNLMVATEYSIINQEPPEDLKQCAIIQGRYSQEEICCEKGEHLYNKKLCYRVFFDQYKTEDEASNACDQETSILMSPCDKAELNWVKRLLSWYYMDSAWLRAKRENSFHKFKWERFQDSTVSYWGIWGIWRRTDPFHKQPNENDEENCLYIDTFNLEGKISNIRCGMKMGFACVRPVHYEVTEHMSKHDDYRKDSWGSNNGGCYGDCPPNTVTCTCNRNILCN